MRILKLRSRKARVGAPRMYELKNSLDWSGISAKPGRYTRLYDSLSTFRPPNRIVCRRTLICKRSFPRVITNVAYTVMSNLIKASVIQCSTVKYDLDATLEKMDRLVKVARERDGSQLAVFPEAL